LYDYNNNNNDNNVNNDNYNDNKMARIYMRLIEQFPIVSLHLNVYQY